jgi:hypothetical protein
MPEEEDTAIQKYKPEMMCKKNVTMIHVSPRNFQYSDFFRSHVPAALTLPLSWTKTRKQQSKSLSLRQCAKITLL